MKLRRTLLMLLSLSGILNAILLVILFQAPPPGEVSPPAMRTRSPVDARAAAPMKSMATTGSRLRLDQAEDRLHAADSLRHELLELALEDIFFEPAHNTLETNLQISASLAQALSMTTAEKTNLETEIEELCGLLRSAEMASARIGAPVHRPSEGFAIILDRLPGAEGAKSEFRLRAKDILGSSRGDFFSSIALNSFMLGGVEFQRRIEFRPGYSTFLSLVNDSGEVIAGRSGGGLEAQIAERYADVLAKFKADSVK